MGGRRFNGEGGRGKVGKENQYNENSELKRCVGRIPKSGSREEKMSYYLGK